MSDYDDLNDSPKEHCGLFGVFGVKDCAGLVYRGLFSQQHRGQEGAGIVVSDGNQIRSIKGMGLVNEVFTKSGLDELKGSLAVGHVRYSTTGSTRIQNVQPLVAECSDGLWVVAHNGNLVNADKLRLMYQDAGAIFQTSTDSEVLIHILADPMYRKRPHRAARALSELRGAFSFLIMTKSCLMAARDPHGFRPLSIGRLGDGYVFSSETCGLRQVGATYLRDVKPGELVIVDDNGLRSTQFAEKATELGQCVFEMVYFARPDSVVFGENVHVVRVNYGMALAREYPVEADIVIPVPDSGNSAALGYSRQSGITLDYGFIRNHYVGRTFIMPQQNDRSAGVDMKLTVIPEVVEGKRVVIVDDSIVRGTTARKRVVALRDAGAKEVHVRISCPPVSHPCFFGIDFPTKDELIAGSMDVKEIGAYLNADSVGYLSVESLLAPYKNGKDFCNACFTGAYKLPVDENRSKMMLEQHSMHLQLDL